MNRLVLTAAASVVVLATSVAWAGADEPRLGGEVAGSSAMAGSKREPLLLPQFSGTSGDLSLSRQPTIGTLHRDDKGQLEPGFYFDAMSNRRHGPLPAERARLGETDSERRWDFGAVIGYQLSDSADPRTGAGINLQVVTGGQDFESGMLLQPGFDYTMPFSDSVHLSARIFGTYQPQAGNRAAAGTPEANAPALRGGEAEGGWRDVGVNLGVGYTFTDRWSLETQAGFTHSLGERDRTPGSKEEQQPRGEIFGGVFLNYRF